MLQIFEATADQISIAKELFLEYARSLDFDLAFQDFEKEVAALPGAYSDPDGCILLAFQDAEVAGCVALRRLEPGIGEMKRLYVKPKFQKRGMGRALANAVIEKAAQFGYPKIRLDTVPTMQAAIQMYRSMGFYSIAPYRENPISGASYLEKEI